MKATIVETIYYDFDDEVLKDYLNYCNEEDIDPSYFDFINWIQMDYDNGLDCYFEDEDWDYESVNGSFKINDAFAKEIERIKQQND